MEKDSLERRLARVLLHAAEDFMKTEYGTEAARWTADDGSGFTVGGQDRPRVDVQINVRHGEMTYPARG